MPCTVVAMPGSCQTGAADRAGAAPGGEAWRPGFRGFWAIAPESTTTPESATALVEPDPGVIASLGVDEQAEAGGVEHQADGVVGERVDVVATDVDAEAESEPEHEPQHERQPGEDHAERPAALAVVGHEPCAGGDGDRQT